MKSDQLTINKSELIKNVGFNSATVSLHSTRKRKMKFVYVILFTLQFR